MRHFGLQAIVVALLLATAYPAFAQKYTWDIDEISSTSTEVPLLVRQGVVFYRLNPTQLQALKESRWRLQSIAGIAINKLYVIDGDEANALSGYGKEGSFIAFNTKILDAMGNDPDAIAAIMGHEIAHLKLNHLQRRQEVNTVIEVIGLIVGVAVEVAAQSKWGVSGVGSQVEGLGKTIASTAFTRDQEREADNFGTRWAANAGYSPDGAVRAHKMLLALKGSGGIPFLNTHPSSRERIETLERLAAELKQSSTVVAMRSTPMPPAVRQNSGDAIVGRSIPRASDMAAFNYHRRAADQGEAQAQVIIGYMYQYGRGIPKDDAEAVKWYRRAAEQGNAVAQYNLGVMYDEGKGVTQAYAEAVEWWRKAAEQGNADAQFNLGGMYANGWSVTQDHAEAVKWYRRAAEQGNALAQYNIGVLYAKGSGISKDCITARQWLEKAAMAGDQIAPYMLRSGVNGACRW